MKINISFIALNGSADFVRLFLLCQHCCLNTSISVFLLLSKDSVLAHFQEFMRWLFTIQTFITLVIHFPFKTKQQENKTTFTATRRQECSPTNRRQPTRLFFGELSKGLCADWLVFITYCIFCHLIGLDRLSYFFKIGQFAYL